MSPKGGFDLSDYVDVPARLAWFFEKYPEGSLQAEIVVGPEQGLPFITVRAFAHRSLNDTHPGTGLAYEVFPGVTPYTKGSEVMNAETSAWGRALAAIGAPTKGHVASANEVQGAAARRTTPVPKAESSAVQGEKPAQGVEPEPDALVLGEGSKVLAPLPADHQHTFVQSPTLKKFVVCSDPACRKVVKKEDVDAAS